jgi:hypothetical protein
MRMFLLTQEQGSDGNLTQDSRWNYTWDAENRLVRMVAKPGAWPQQRIDFGYDWRGRRNAKKVWNNTGGTGPLAVDLKFVYDDLNLYAPTIARVMPAEINRCDSFSVTNPSQSEGKLTYLKLNMQTPCPPPLSAEWRMKSAECKVSVIPSTSINERHRRRSSSAYDIYDRFGLADGSRVSLASLFLLRTFLT